MGIGYKFNFRDPLWLTEMNLTFSYTPTQWFNSLSDDPNESNTLAEDETFHASMNLLLETFSFASLIILPISTIYLGPQRDLEKESVVA